MKLFFLILVSSFHIISFAQQDTKQITFDAWDKPPIYPGCETLNSPYELKKCMNQKISLLIENNFNKDIAKSLKLKDSLVKIVCSYKIDTQGNIINIKIKAPHHKLKKEAKRVIKLTPKMISPATHQNKSVITIYKSPIMFAI